MIRSLFQKLRKLMAEFATRNSFLTGCKRRYGTHTLTSGVTVRFQSLTEAEQSEHEMEVFQRDGTGLLMRDDQGNLVRDEQAITQNRSRLIVLTLVDESGNRLLSNADIPQVEMLDGADTRTLYQAIQEHCGMVERRDAKKNVSSTNSPPTPASDSPTASPPS